LVVVRPVRIGQLDPDARAEVEAGGNIPRLIPGIVQEDDDQLVLALQIALAAQELLEIGRILAKQVAQVASGSDPIRNVLLRDEARAGKGLSSLAAILTLEARRRPRKGVAEEGRGEGIAVVAHRKSQRHDGGQELLVPLLVADVGSDVVGDVSAGDGPAEAPHSVDDGSNVGEGFFLAGWSLEAALPTRVAARILENNQLQ